MFLSTTEYTGSSSSFLAFFDPLFPLVATKVYKSPVGPAAWRWIDSGAYNLYNKNFIKFFS